MAWLGRLTVGAVAVGGGAVAGYLGLVTGAMPLDVGVGRRTRPLGPQAIDIAAPREVVFDVIAQPYLGRATRAMREKLRVLERGGDMVLAAHFTPVGGGRLTATTVETVRFTAPERVDFRLVRGPVPHVVESFVLTANEDEDEGEDADEAGTRLAYEGELGTDGWALGARWGRAVASRWEATVASSLDAVRQEAERRARRGPGGG